MLFRPHCFLLCFIIEVPPRAAVAPNYKLYILSVLLKGKTCQIYIRAILTANMQDYKPVLSQNVYYPNCIKTYKTITNKV